MWWKRYYFLEIEIDLKNNMIRQGIPFLLDDKVQFMLIILVP
jgi:hypothetical protein